MSGSLRPHGLLHGVLQARILEWVAFPFSRGSSQPRDRTQVSCIAGRFFPAEPQGKPKNTRVGSLSLLQGIFPTQESNQSLLHCRWILYQLSHKGNPKNTGVGSLALLQGIFPTQESNWGLLHCRQILYQLSYQGSKARKHKETDCPQELPERLEPFQYLDLGPIKPILNF